MARGRYYHDPSRKHIEQYQDFSGGLNTTSSNENTSDRELTLLENVDLGERGSLKRRKGIKTAQLPLGAEAKAQGIFRYYRKYTPYNIMGIDGSFRGRLKDSYHPDPGKIDGLDIGGWFAQYFHSPNETKRLQEPDGTSYISLTSKATDSTRSRAMRYKATGLKENTYYLFLVKFKSDGVGKGRIACRDERYGIFRDNSGDTERLFVSDFNDKPSEWTSKYVVMETFHGTEEGSFYVYNHTPLGTEGTVFYKEARVYEITSEVAEKIDVDPEYTGELLEEKFPYTEGLLKSETIEETVIAYDGKFYVDGVEKPVKDDLVIQKDRTMEAVVYGDNLLIASGSGLLVYNGSTIFKINPYNPDSLETLYIGHNALIEHPFDLGEEEQGAVEIKKIHFSRRYGVANKPISIEVGVGKPGSVAIEYKYEVRNVKDKEGYWRTLKDWSLDMDCTFTLEDSGEYQFRVSIRVENTTEVIEELVVPRYIVQGTDTGDMLPIDGHTINQCNRIMVHWERILLYGDTAKPDVLYMSDLYNPAYFPVNNTLWLENPRKEDVTSIVRYRDRLVIFTPTSIQALYGTSPESYQRIMLNTSIGCISPRGAEVVQNHIIFPSYEGIALLKTVGTSESRANVELIDTNIKNLVPLDTNAVAYVRDNQYCIVYPNERKRLRYYYEWGVWAQDISDSLDFEDALVKDTVLYALGQDGRIMTDADNYADEGTIFEMKVETKQVYFGEPYATKKTRELQLMLEKEESTEVQTSFFLDNNLTKSELMKISGEDEVYKITVPGKGISAKLGLVHKEDKPFTLVGFGLIFKLKKP